MQKQWRLDYANHLFDSFEFLTKEIEAVFIGGSVGGKYVDKYSDLELCIIWKKEIDCGIIDKFHQKEQLDLFVSKNIEVPLKGIEYSMVKNDFQIDFYHYSLKDFDRLLDFYTEEKISLDIQSLYYVLLNCKILKGKTYLENLKKSIEVYPISLAKKNVKKYIRNFLKADGHLFIERKDWIIFYNLISGYQKIIFLTLLSLNSSYFPSYKNIPFYVDKLAVKPESIFLLYTDFYRLPPKKMWDILMDVQQDILRLVKEIYPDIDVEENLKHLNYRRKAKEEILGLIN